MIDMVAILDMSDQTDLNTMKEGRKEEPIEVSDDTGDCIDSMDMMDIMKDDKSDADDLYVMEGELEETKIELFRDEIYCCGEVGDWKESRWGSRMKNAGELRNGEEMVKRHHEEVD